MTKCKSQGTKSLWDNKLDGEVIFGNLNQVYPIRILGDARLEGTNAVYKCELMGGNTNGIPSERLLSGERFSVGFAPVEKELSRRVGDRHAIALQRELQEKLGKNGGSSVLNCEICRDGQHRANLILTRSGSVESRA